MNQKTPTSKKAATTTEDKRDEDLKWLAEFQNVLSPYWSARVEYSPEKERPLLVLEDSKPEGR